MKNGWSFCIVTALGNDKVLSKCIDSIVKEFSENKTFEVIVVGETKINHEKKYSEVNFITINEDFFNPDFSLSNIKRSIKELSIKRLFFKYGPISYKKNHAAKQAKYNKLCIMHDYVGLEKGWLSGFNNFGNNWDVSMNIILNQDNTRYRDWCAWDYPGIGPGLLSYDHYIKEMYISGTYFCVKRKFFIENLLDENLFWGESEDVEWSLRIREKTQFKMNTKSKVKFLKLKPLDQPPYNDIWVQNTVKLNQLRIKNDNI